MTEIVYAFGVPLKYVTDYVTRRPVDTAQEQVLRKTVGLQIREVPDWFLATIPEVKSSRTGL